VNKKAEELVQSGKLPEALELVQGQIRDNPAKPELRTFLFQLLCVSGDWDRALTQLNVVADMDNDALLMAQTYRELLRCEAYRSEVFAGNRAPLLFGEPNDWVGAMVQSLGSSANGKGEAALEFASAALESAPARSGNIDDVAFDWLADADMRLGPIFEIILNGKYYWVPAESIAEIKFSEPEDLRDLVWIGVQIRWVNEGNSIGFMPVRYPGTQNSDDSNIAMSRKTEWQDIGAEFFIGSGQRMFATADKDYSLLETRCIVFDEPVES